MENIETYRIDRAYNKIYKYNAKQAAYLYFCSLQADQVNDSDDEIIEYLESQEQFNFNY